MQCQIRVRGHLGPAWGDHLAGLRIAHEATGCSLLAGHPPDQAALHGVLLQFVRLGLPLLSLETGEGTPPEETGGAGGLGVAGGPGGGGG